NSAREELRASAKYVDAAAISTTSIDVLHKYLDVRVLALPALPVTTIGIGVSLYLGFKTTSAYNRWW
ncbi:MAG: bestrophin family ion channel, partial [Pseudomonadales bacterium]